MSCLLDFTNITGDTSFTGYITVEALTRLQLICYNITDNYLLVVISTVYRDFPYHHSNFVEKFGQERILQNLTWSLVRLHIQFHLKPMKCVSLTIRMRFAAPQPCISI